MICLRFANGSQIGGEAEYEGAWDPEEPSSTWTHRRPWPGPRLGQFEGIRQGDLTAL